MADIESKALTVIYGEEPASRPLLDSASAGHMTAEDWRRIALSNHRDPRDRCFAAWKLGDLSLWERLHHDPTLADWTHLTGQFFPSRSRVTNSTAFDIPTVSRDDYRLELVRLLQHFIQESSTGRCYWRDIKQRLPQLETSAELTSIFRSRTFITGEDLDQHLDRPPGGKYRISAAIHDEQFLLLMLNTSPETHRRIVEDPHLARFGRWFGVVAVSNRGHHPMLGNNIAWIGIDPWWKRGAWLITEVVSYIVQACGKRSPLLKKLDVFPELEARKLAAFKASIRREFGDWSDSAMCTALHAARRNGVDELYMYTPRHVRVSSSDITRSLAVAHYRDLPLRYGFERREVKDAAEDSKIFWYRKLG